MADLTRHFSTYELECPCCKEMNTDIGFIHRMDIVRDLYANPISPSSGYRCPHYNQNIAKSGATGPHTQCAIDIPCHGMDFTALLEIAFYMKFKGVGIYQNGDIKKRFIHLDDVDRKVNYTVIWSG